jgi:hypothetical protein
MSDTAVDLEALQRAIGQRRGAVEVERYLAVQQPALRLVPQPLSV